MLNLSFYFLFYRNNDWVMFVLIFYKDTGKYFETRNKKTNLSDQFKAEEDPK